MEHHAATFPGHHMRRCYVRPERYLKDSALLRTARPEERWFCCHECCHRGDLEATLIPESVLFGGVSSHAQPSAAAAAAATSPRAVHFESTPPDSMSPIAPDGSNLEGFPMRKKALLVGVSYYGTADKLEGTAGDVARMAKLLIKHWGYHRDDVRILSEAYDTGDPDTCPNDKPTKGNIVAAMKWLAADAQFGDRLVFYFAGHGVYRPDTAGDESDGRDDALVPSDFRTKGVIADNRVHKLLVQPLREGVRLHTFVDCCHSGTMIDLPWIWDGDDNLDDTKWITDSTREWQAFKSSRGTVIGLSCVDAPSDKDGGLMFRNYTGKQGALTFSLVYLVELNSLYPQAKIASTYFELVTSMRALLSMLLTPQLAGKETPRIRALGSSTADFSDALHEMVDPIPMQVPQLFASERIDLHAPFTLAYHPQHDDSALGGSIHAKHFREYKERHMQTLRLVAENSPDGFDMHMNYSAKV